MACVTCGHSIEEHRWERAECEYDDGDGNRCAVSCGLYEQPEDEEKNEAPEKGDEE